MAATSQSLPKDQKSDERLRPESRLRKLLRRPELGAVGGAILVWLLFAGYALYANKPGFISLAGTANYLEVAAELGILAVAVSMLMIGGEFDLSIGSIIGASGMITAILSAELHWNLWPAILVSLIVSLAIGWLNGFLVVRTRLPSFIITLASLFIVRGATLALTRLITGRTQVGRVRATLGYDTVVLIFGGKIQVANPANANLPVEFSITIIWWLVIASIVTYFLLRTRPGNWIFGIGGDQTAARNVGVPVGRMKIILFMLTAFAAWLVATIQVITAGGADTLRGENREFYAIIGAVIGGTLLTGGYGSAIGAVLGALIVGMVQQGIFFSGIDSDWSKVFLGGLLIIAVLINNYIRRRASQAK